MLRLPRIRGSVRPAGRVVESIAAGGLASRRRHRGRPGTCRPARGVASAGCGGARRRTSGCRRPKMRPVRHSRRTLPTQRSICAFAFGARTGVRITRVPSLLKTASKARLNLLSRSWIRNRHRAPRSSRFISKLRACCSIHPPSGLLVQATYSIRRLPMPMKKRTYSRRSRVDREEVTG